MQKRVLIVGGSEEFTGALYLAGVSALRSGAESVVVMAPEKVAWALNALSPDLVTRKLPGKYLSAAHLPKILQQIKTADVLVLGNGATTRPGTAALLRALMQLSIIKVVDADAIKVLKKNSVRNAILTPNEGEWKLLVQNNNIETLLKNGNVIIKKGGKDNRTEIFYQRKKFRLSRTNPGLDKAGTGDVLTGMCAGYLAEGAALLAAAKSAAKLGNLVANILTKKKKGYFFLASDIVEELKKTKR